jgi:hypothetical protein
MGHFVPSRGTLDFLCRAMGHFVPSRGTLDFLCRAVAHFVPSCGTVCAVLWHSLCRPVAHFVPSRGTCYSVPSCQELQVKNCKKKELQKKSFRQFEHFFRGLINERIFSFFFIFILVLATLNERFRHCISMTKMLNSENLLVESGLEPQSTAFSADKVLYNYAIEQCQAAALDELFGNPEECFHVSILENIFFFQFFF